MKIIHTSDWHFGSSLYGNKRQDEFQEFLEFFSNVIKKENPDVIIVAGDIFDTGTPSTQAQKLYYDFLKTASLSDKREIIIIGGNHDSPSFLNAPKEILKLLNVTVVGAISQDPSDELILIKDTKGNPALIVCAVPYLRDRDIKKAQQGESPEEQEKKRQEGIVNHFKTMAELAEKMMTSLKMKLPIIATGHLFTKGGVPGDKERNLYTGSLGLIDSSKFPAIFDYIALGHLHIPQNAGGNAYFSGSPIPIGFSEIHTDKQLNLIEFNEKGEKTVSFISIPKFRHMEVIKGDWETISDRLVQLKSENKPALVEIEYTHIDIIENLREKVEEIIKDTPIDAVKISNRSYLNKLLAKTQWKGTLKDIKVEEVFHECLKYNNIPEESHKKYTDFFKEILTSVENMEK